MTYDALVTAVSERSDLFVQTMETMFPRLEGGPERLIVHENVRKGSTPGPIGQWLKDKCPVEYVHRVNDRDCNYGPAMLWCFQQARTPIVFYTQEDWDFVRSIPVTRCMEIMERHGLHHVRFNKRKTMSAKHADTSHPWHKVEVEFFDGAGEAQKMCISDHWYTQASLWRVDLALKGIAATAEKSPQANAFVAAFNHWMNMKYIGDAAKVMDQALRHERMKTYIWGPVAEPAFIKHLGSARTTGTFIRPPEKIGR